MKKKTPSPPTPQFRLRKKSATPPDVVSVSKPDTKKTSRLKDKNLKPLRTPRAMAVDILNRVESAGAFAEPLLDACLTEESFPHPHDKALITQIVYGTLRMQGRLDWIITQIYSGQYAAMETGIRNILRTALYQMIFTDRIPAFAAVNEAVKLTNNSYPGRGPLVNAILRNSIRTKETIAYPDLRKDPAGNISVFHSHPLWLVKRWIGIFGVEETLALCKANNEIPPVAVRANILKASPQEVIARLEQEGILAKPAAFAPDALLIQQADKPLRQTEAFQSGLIHIQDEASQMIAHLVAPRASEAVLDVCAGIGGKATHLAAMMENRGSMIALDISEAKVGVLMETAKRMGATIVEGRMADATTDLGQDFRERFDRVLVDVPCSGVGTLRRNPEIKWRLKPEDLKPLSALQKKILKIASRCLKRGGTLVYSTCTVMPEENEGVVEDFLARYTNFQRIQPTSTTISHALFDREGCFRTLPHKQGTDGFFAAVLKKD